jgi:hypothetical protein
MKTKPISKMLSAKIGHDNWDVLIFLDACRYDIFKQVYKDIIGGNLDKAISPARHTLEYFEKVFPDVYEDIVYVSANALLNSKGVVYDIGDNSYDARKHFNKVIDVWEVGWDKKLKTVHPKEVNKHATVAFCIYPKKKVILHYVQPHAPYIYHKKYGTRALIRSQYKKSFLLGFVMKYIKHETLWKVADKFGALPTDGMGYLWKQVGKEGIIEGYTEDLKLVLGYVKQLMDKHPKKKFIITSDHGERLGEKGNYGHHHTGEYDKEIIEVPWWTK